MNDNQYTYTYSAAEQAELKKIREKYCAHEENKMEQLRRLDESATKKGTVISLLVGILGCLILGTGMSCVMVWGDRLFLPGVVIGALGIVCVACAYPVYIRITKVERERIAPEILRLTDELMK